MNDVQPLQSFLSDPPPASVIGAATDWVNGTVFGPLATSIAIIAIAALGLTMLQGRINIRRGLSAIVGCFLLFGAAAIANGLRSAAQGESQLTPTPSAPPPPAFASPTPPSPGAYDPYAGASMPR